MPTGCAVQILALLPLNLIRSKIPGRVEACLLHPKGCDEDIDDDCDENESCCSIVEYIQAGLFCHIVQVQTSSDDEKDPNHHLEEEGDADEHNEGGVVLEGSPLLQHGFELCDICHEQCHIQHTLCHALLCCVVVDVHWPIGSQMRIHALNQFSAVNKSIISYH